MPTDATALASAIRKALAEGIEQHQRGIAARALVDGVGLSLLSTGIGKAPNALQKRWGDLRAETTDLVWLRDHVRQWATACGAAAEALLQTRIPSFETELRHDVHSLGRAGSAGDWKLLAGTPDIARRLIAHPKLWTQATDPHRDQLVDLDRALPPSRRERAVRRPVARVVHAPPR